MGYAPVEHVEGCKRHKRASLLHAGHAGAARGAGAVGRISPLQARHGNLTWTAQARSSRT